MLNMTEGIEIAHKDAYLLVKNEQLGHITISSQLLAGSLVTSSTYSNVVFSRCVFYGCNIKRVSFINCTFENCNFEFSHLYNCHFKNCRFVNCQWKASSSRDATLEGCLMEEDSFQIFENENTIIPNMSDLEEPIAMFLANAA